MRKLIIFVFFIFILKYRIKEVKTIDIRRCSPNKSSATASSRLKDHLFCSYDSNERPVERKKSIQAFIQMTPKFMEFVSILSLNFENDLILFSICNFNQNELNEKK